MHRPQTTSLSEIFHELTSQRRASELHWQRSFGGKLIEGHPEHAPAATIKRFVRYLCAVFMFTELVS
jgi:hypothetical protein